MTVAKAAWSVFLDGVNLTPVMNPRLIALTITEKRSEAADQLDIVLDDKDGKVAIPRKGAVLRVSMGWLQGDNLSSGLPIGLIDKGAFKVDEVGGGGPFDTITLRARSADFTDAFRVRRQRSYVGQTVGHVITAIASANGLKASVAPSLTGKVIPALGHAAKSDSAMLRELGRRFDATATVKAGVLVFAPSGSDTTAGGVPLDGVTLDRREAPQRTWSCAEQSESAGVKAVWHDKAGAQQHSVTIGHSGSGTPKRLRRIYHNEADATQAAEAEHARTARGKWTYDTTLALGRPDWYPGRKLTLTGDKAELMAQKMADRGGHPYHGWQRRLDNAPADGKRSG
ncbi:phage protein D [Asticcacaulis biprosthecium C19]|uniref:Phage protein D n=1 Tax=Asticcacaulis biprosthecium C19 TaxID=715226 RepID=F4QJB1_9CAUL|nr:contractile injection system protein, VgrG/Pvc8 family [Asticcacaulis biprosthecium]EGF93094.1 phage protein D [Asticcacaulis biprosthecium C19]